MTRPGIMPRINHKFLLAVMFAAAVAASFSVRTFICNRDINSVRQTVNADFVPYLVESSIMYGYARDVGTGKGIPEYDQRLIGMEKVRVREQMPLGVEYFLGYSWRLKNAVFGRPAPSPESLDYDDTPDAAGFMRNILRFWSCLTAGFIFLWLYWLGCPLTFAFCGALLHAVAPAAIARHTGQDILCEPFALPFIAMAFACRAAALKYKTPILSALSTAAVFAATAFWDMSQICFLLFATYELARWLTGGKVITPVFSSLLNSESNSPREIKPKKIPYTRYSLFLLWYAALVLSALLVPYNRAHQFICSPLLMVAFPSLLLLPLFRVNGWRRRLLLFLTVIAALGLLWSFTGSGYKQNYNHFQELISAKIKYWNVKPSDPEKLTFASRFLWTPSLHSATMAITGTMFPASYWLMLLALMAGLCFRRGREYLCRGFSCYSLPLWMTVIFFVFFVYMVRFHVFCALFLSVAFPLIMYELSRIGRKSCITVLIILLSALLLEGETGWKMRRSYPENFLRETANLVKWLRVSNTADRVILADMGLSPVLKAYTGAAILIQPKFELPATRKIVEDYVMTMFHGTELDFARFCELHNVDLVIYNRNTATAPMHPYSYRYMAAARNVNKKSAAFLMDMAPAKMNYFYPVAPPVECKELSRRYILFKFIPPHKKRIAQNTAELARYYLDNGNMQLAEKLAVAAYITDPLNQNAYIMYYKIFQKIPDFTLAGLMAQPKQHLTGR